MTDAALWSAPSLVLLFAVFLIAGAVKGAVGFGLPMVVVAVLTAIHGLTTAMALMLVPALVINVWQAVQGGAFRALVVRLWPFLASACLFTWLSTGLLARADAAILTGGLGVLVAFYALISLATPPVPPPGRHERWLAPAVGAVNGIITGLTGTYVLPSGIYLQLLGLDRDALVQAMGIVFTVSTAMLAAALAGRSLLPGGLAGLSAAALVPSLIGVEAGRRLRRSLPERTFRKAFLSALAALGVYLIWRAVG